MSLPHGEPAIRIVKSFSSLSGTSPTFTLPAGYYFVSFDAADPNVATTVSVVDNTTGITLISIDPNLIGNTDFNLVGQEKGWGFQVGPNDTTLKLVVSAGGTAASVVVQG